jgi:hypothetical protein
MRKGSQSRTEKADLKEFSVHPLCLSVSVLRGLEFLFNHFLKLFETKSRKHPKRKPALQISSHIKRRIHLQSRLKRLAQIRTIA